MAFFVRETNGDLFGSRSEAIVNAVNCGGVMGAGIEREFKRRFPADYFDSYTRACRGGELVVGSVQVYRLKEFHYKNVRYIINFPTKSHWREQSRLADVESGLQSLVKIVKQHAIKSIALPALGCGLGGLDYIDVKLLVEAAFADVTEVEVLLFAPK